MYHFINDNFHTDIATVPPSYKMKHFHEHNRWELMFIYSGSCTLYVGDEIYMLNPGGRTAGARFSYETARGAVVSASPN